MDLSNVTIETERLLLVPMSEKYREDIFQNFTEEITEYLFAQPTDNIQDTDIFITRAKKNITEGSSLTISIINALTGEFIGCGGIHKLKTKTPEFGIWVKKSTHGNRYGREAVIGLKEWAENIGYKQFTYGAVVHNEPSKGIAKSLGGFVVGIKPYFNQTGKKHEIVVYRITL